MICRWIKRVFLLVGWISLLYYLPYAERTKKTEPAGPGCTFIKIIDTDIPLHICILKVDLMNKSIGVQSVLAKKVLTGENETVLAMAQHNDRPGNRVVGGVNADYFPKGIPSGLTVTQGRLIKVSRGWSSLVFSRENKPDIGVFSHDLLLTTIKGKKIGKVFLNRSRHNNNIVLYTEAYGGTTGSKTDGKALILDPGGGVIPTKGGRSARVEKKHTLPQQNEVIKNKWVLSFGNKFSEQAEDLKTGELLFLRVSVEPTNARINNAVSGGPRILRRGRISIEVAEEGQRVGFDTELHPRTAAGFTHDGQYLFLVVVDGRQSGFSIGIDLHDLAQLMLDLGCYEALNLDGGGSSTLVVGNKIVNRPSDITGPRPVANALLIVKMQKK